MTRHAPCIDRRNFLAGTAASVVAAMTGQARAAVTPFFKRAGLPIGLELYLVLPEAEKDLDGTLKAVADIGYRTVELPHLLGRTPVELRMALDRAGLSCPSMLLEARGPGSLADDPSKLAHQLHVLGARTVVVPGHIPDRFGGPVGNEGYAGYLRRVLPQVTADDWNSFADFLNARGRLLKSAGIRAGYHNHNFELAPVGNSTGLEILIDNTDPELVTFELDVGWVAAAGIDPLAFLGKHKGRIGLMHVKDIKRRTKANFYLDMVPAEVGRGSIDWKKILPAAHSAGVRDYFVEQEPPYEMGRLDAARTSYTYLASLT